VPKKLFRKYGNCHLFDSFFLIILKPFATKLSENIFRFGPGSLSFFQLKIGKNTNFRIIWKINWKSKMFSDNVVEFFISHFFHKKWNWSNTPFKRNKPNEKPEVPSSGSSSRSLSVVMVREKMGNDSRKLEKCVHGIFKLMECMPCPQ